MYNDAGTVVELVLPVSHADRDELARMARSPDAEPRREAQKQELSRQAGAAGPTTLCAACAAPLRWSHPKCPDFLV